jgi:redox-sensing transcriptional repressor
VNRTVPAATVQRLPVYLQILERLPDDVISISSEELAERAGVNSAKVRKDLSYLGSYGTRGVGYDAEHLRYQIRVVLGLDRGAGVVIVGIGNLGRALANFRGFGQHGFRVVAVVDDDPEVVGTVVAGQRVEPFRRLTEIVEERGAEIGVITVPATSAQAVADALAAAGVRGILNFAPKVLSSEGVEVRNVDLSNELQVLSYYLHGSHS